MQRSSCNKLRGHCWALRRVQEIKSLCSREHKAWRPFNEYRHLGSRLREYTKAGHLDIGHRLAKDIGTAQRQHNNSNEQLWDGLKADNTQSMDNWIGYLKSVVGTLQQNEGNANRDSFGKQVQESIDKGTSMMYRLMKKKAPLTTARVVDKCGDITHCSIFGP